MKFCKLEIYAKLVVKSGKRLVQFVNRGNFEKFWQKF